MQALLKRDASTPEIVEELYLAALNRRPTTAERDGLVAKLGAEKAAEALPDLFWALLNTKEFAFNH